MGGGGESMLGSKDIFLDRAKRELSVMQMNHCGIQECEKCETQCTTWYDDRSGTDLSGAVHYGAWFSQLYTMG